MCLVFMKDSVEGFKFPEQLKDDSYLLQLFGDYLYQLW